MPKGSSGYRIGWVALVGLCLAPITIALADPVPLETDVDTVSVPSENDGVLSNAILVNGTTYRLEVSGTYVWTGGVGSSDKADAECSVNPSGIPGYFPPDSTWIPDRFAAAYGASILDLTVDGFSLEWNPITPDAEGCNTQDHRYDSFILMNQTRKISFRILDGSRGDNSGSLTVKIFRQIANLPLPPVPAPVPTLAPVVAPGPGSVQEPTPPPTTLPPGIPPTVPPAPPVTPPPFPPGVGTTMPIQTLTIDSSGPAQSTVSLKKGWVYLFQASGTYRFTGATYHRWIESDQIAPVFDLPYLADAECSINNVGGSVRIQHQGAELVWDRNNYGTDPDFLDLYVGGTRIDWAPEGPGSGGCDLVGHTYGSIFIPASTGSLSAYISDPEPQNNSGSLVLKIYLLAYNTPVEVIAARGPELGLV